MTEHGGHVALIAGGIAGLVLLFSGLAPAAHRPARPPGLRGVVVGNVAAGLIHLAVIPAHLSESLLSGAFFLAVGVVQLAAARTASERASERFLRATAAINLGVVVVWGVSRTSGLPLGPEPWVTENVGFADVAASTAELVAAWGALRLARAPRAARLAVGDPDQAAERADVGGSVG